MPKPNKKQPKRTVLISCMHCKTNLFKYRKGGKGALVKCFVERITEDYTHDKIHCPQCEQEFARETMIRGAPALKIIGGKVHMK
ncbi:hypothetical protein [Aestuariibacter salexigens]|uniref:hypothetical protein n=1 Tax=Aestuariibacter salexigens TaxID=226010 RepID=UPI0004225E4C|nr:hypothetical protein [Aestuariibacter salexigens]